jgi:hypothetical protein
LRRNIQWDRAKISRTCLINADHAIRFVPPLAEFSPLKKENCLIWFFSGKRNSRLTEQGAQSMNIRYIFEIGKRRLTEEWAAF